MTSCNLIGLTGFLSDSFYVIDVHVNIIDIEPIVSRCVKFISLLKGNMPRKLRYSNLIGQTRFLVTLFRFLCD